MLEVQFQHIKGVGQFKDISAQVVLMPLCWRLHDVVHRSHRPI
jgi:hypothetical protein